MTNLKAVLKCQNPQLKRLALFEDVRKAFFGSPSVVDQRIEYDVAITTGQPASPRQLQPLVSGICDIARFPISYHDDESNLGLKCRALLSV